MANSPVLESTPVTIKIVVRKWPDDALGDRNFSSIINTLIRTEFEFCDSKRRNAQNMSGSDLHLYLFENSRGRGMHFTPSYVSVYSYFLAANQEYQYVRVEYEDHGPNPDF